MKELKPNCRRPLLRSREERHKNAQKSVIARLLFLVVLCQLTNMCDMIVFVFSYPSHKRKKEILFKCFFFNSKFCLAFYFLIPNFVFLLLVYCFLLCPRFCGRKLINQTKLNKNRLMLLKIVGNESKIDTHSKKMFFFPFSLVDTKKKLNNNIVYDRMPFYYYFGVDFD